jgi:hypothetical protein
MWRPGSSLGVLYSCSSVCISLLPCTRMMLFACGWTFKIPFHSVIGTLAIMDTLYPLLIHYSKGLLYIRSSFCVYFQTSPPTRGLTELLIWIITVLYPLNISFSKRREIYLPLEHSYCPHKSPSVNYTLIQTNPAHTLAFPFLWDTFLCHPPIYA